MPAARSVPTRRATAAWKKLRERPSRMHSESGSANRGVPGNSKDESVKTTRSPACEYEKRAAESRKGVEDASVRVEGAGV